MHSIKKFFKACWRKIKGFWSWYKKLYKGRKWYIKTAAGIVTFFLLFFSWNYGLAIRNCKLIIVVVGKE